jgi:hypothetical protein
MSYFLVITCQRGPLWLIRTKVTASIAGAEEKLVVARDGAYGEATIEA